MVRYQDLQDRLDRGDVIILDGAIGTQLQAMGVPMNVTDWAAAGLLTHPYTVRHMHENYIEAGVWSMATNTYHLLGTTWTRWAWATSRPS